MCYVVSKEWQRTSIITPRFLANLDGDNVNDPSYTVMSWGMVWMAQKARSSVTDLG